MKIKTIQELETLRPCPEGLAFAKSHASLSEAWEKCENGQWMFWLLRMIKPIGSIRKIESKFEAVDTSQVYAETDHSAARARTSAMAARARYRANPNDVTAAEADSAAAAYNAAFKAAYTAEALWSANWIRANVPNPFKKSVVGKVRANSIS